MGKPFKDLPYNDTHNLRVEGKLVEKQTTKKPPIWFRNFEKRIDKRFDNFENRFDNQEEFNKKQEEFNKQQKNFNNQQREYQQTNYQ